MSLKLMYVTNCPDVARIAEESGVDRIFVDMEYIGKAARQGGMDTTQNHHTISDIVNIRNTVRRAQVLVRCNPIHDATSEYGSSREEVDAVVAAGADMIMLPYFKTIREVQTFVELVSGRTRTILLVETPEAVELIDEILEIPGVDEVFVGLNDLSLGYHQKFMFQPLADGTVEMLCRKFQAKGIPYGFGGIAALGKGILPAEYIIREHYRLGSTSVVLSRSFCNTSQIQDTEKIRMIFNNGVKAIRNYEVICANEPETYGENQKKVAMLVRQIAKQE